MSYNKIFLEDFRFVVNSKTFSQTSIRVIEYVISGKLIDWQIEAIIRSKNLELKDYFFKRMFEIGRFREINVQFRDDLHRQLMFAIKHNIFTSQTEWVIDNIVSHSHRQDEIDAILDKNSPNFKLNNYFLKKMVAKAHSDILGERLRDELIEQLKFALNHNIMSDQTKWVVDNILVYGIRHEDLILIIESSNKYIKYFFYQRVFIRELFEKIENMFCDEKDYDRLKIFRHEAIMNITEPWMIKDVCPFFLNMYPVICASMILKAKNINDVVYVMKSYAYIEIKNIEYDREKLISSFCKILLLLESAQDTSILYSNFKLVRYDNPIPDFVTCMKINRLGRSEIIRLKIRMHKVAQKLSIDFDDVRNRMIFIHDYTKSPVNLRAAKWYALFKAYSEGILIPREKAEIVTKKMRISDDVSVVKEDILTIKAILEFFDFTLRLPYDIIIRIINFLSRKNPDVCSINSDKEAEKIANRMINSTIFF